VINASQAIHHLRSGQDITPHDLSFEKGSLDHCAVVDVGTIVAIVNTYRKGLSSAGVAAHIGVDPATLGEWLAWGREPGREPYHTLAVLATMALRSVEGRAVDAWTGAFDKDWRAAQQWLQARFPQDYATGRVQVEHTGVVQHQVSLEPLTPADAREVASILSTVGALDEEPLDVEVIDDDG